jgi:hypothetical protein
VSLHLCLGGLVILARESLQGGESGPEERSEEIHTCGVIFSFHMWFAEGRNKYIHELQKDKSSIGYTRFAFEQTTHVWGLPIGESCIRSYGQVQIHIC